MTSNLLLTQNQQIFNLIQHFNASNFFSTQPQHINLHLKDNQKNINSQTQKTYNQNQNHSIKDSFFLQKLNKSLNLNSLLKRKLTKQKLQQAKSIFLNQSQFTHRKQNKFINTKKDSNILKNKFLQLIQTKKHRVDSDRILLKGKIQKQDFLKQSFQNIRHKKTQRELGLLSLRHSQILLQKEKQIKSFYDKQAGQIKLDRVLSKQKEWRFEKAQEIGECLKRLQLRKSQYKKMKEMKADLNYWIKMNQEQQLIKEFEDALINILEGNPEIFEKNEVVKQQEGRKIELKRERHLKINKGSEFLFTEKRRY